MIDSLHAYPEYKDCGLPWLGCIPKHWEIKPGLAAFAPKQVKNTGLSENTVLSLSYGRIVVKPQEKLHGLVPESFETYQIVEPGDIIIRGTDLQNDKQSLRIGLSRNRGIITSAYICLKPRSTVSSEYAYQILNVYDLTKAIYAYGSGLRQNLDVSDFKRMPVFLPPRDEQDAIVRYLEVMERRIARFIRNRRRLIEVLNEQKQAIINRAVTRGLDPNAPLKPSGIDWLGDIPEHWETIPGRNCLAEKKVPNTGLVESTVLSLSYGNIVVRPEEKLHGLVPASFETYQVIDPQDIICRPTDLQNDKKSLRFGISKFRGIITSAYLCFQPRKAMNCNFTYLLLHTYDIKKIIYRLGSGLRQNLSWNDFKNLPCLLPPIDEQTAIVEYVGKATVGIDRAISQARREIELIGEYRTRLIADVVTGKVDVRHLAPPPGSADLEEVVDEIESQDDTIYEMEDQTLTGEAAHADD